MPRRTPYVAFFAAALCALTPALATAQRPADKTLAGFQYQKMVVLWPSSGVISDPGQFNGYTNYWHSIYWDRQQFGNLFQISLPQVEKTIDQTKVDIAEELGVPGLLFEEGFLFRWLSSSPVELDNPPLAEVEKQAEQSDLMIYADPGSELGRRLAQFIPADVDWRAALKSHQLDAAGVQDVRAFVLVRKERRLFVVMSASRDARVRLRELLAAARDVTSKYDLHRGWFGAETLLHSVTCFPGHPLEVIGQGLNQGNDWFTFSGYMDFMLQAQLPEWLGKVGLNIPTDVGTGKATHSFGTIAYGCRDWKGLKIQDMPTEEEWIKFVRDRGGHIFRPVFSAECDPYKYDGYIAIDGNKKQIDGEDVPFILQTGFIRDDAPAAMVLFAPKGQSWDREAMWQAIMSRREVGVLPQGRMLGPSALRNALQMLLLDRVYLEDYFGDAVQMQAAVEGRHLRVRLANVRGTPLAGKLVIVAAPELELVGEPTHDVSLPPGASEEFPFEVRPRAAAMGRTNPVLATFAWSGRQKRTLAIMDMPPAVSVNRLLYGQAPEVAFPVSLHNFGNQTSLPVRVSVAAKNSPARTVYEKTSKIEVPPGEYRATVVKLPLKPGSYTVKVEALGVSAESQLGVEAAVGRPTVTPVDLNGDGIPEYRLENDKVRVTLLAIGARIIEYYVKERNDNILFKLWPEKEISTDKRPFRERGFYPYGGFEDFLGQASIETHKVYNAEITHAAGSYVQVRMWADYYGNRLEKIFTLYGNSPLVEVRFAIDFKNPELHMIGPQPILELGKRHGTEDAFFVPTVAGLREFHMRPEEYFGEVMTLKEGWNAGRDTVEDVCFVGAYPVSEPEFLHLWMNHPSNGESNHYYAELQPWVPIFHKNVRYFTYYLWGAPGRWEDALEALRQRNLITSR